MRVQLVFQYRFVRDSDFLIWLGDSVPLFVRKRPNALGFRQNAIASVIDGVRELVKQQLFGDLLFASGLMTMRLFRKSIAPSACTPTDAAMPAK